MNRPLGRASLGLEWMSDEENRSCRMGGKSEIPDPANDTSLPSRLSPERCRSTRYFLSSNYSDPNGSESDNNNDERSDNEDTQINRPRVSAGLRGASKTELSTEVVSENETNVDLFGFGTGPGTNEAVYLPFSGHVESDENVGLLSNSKKNLDSQVIEENMRRGDGHVIDINCTSGQVYEGGEGNLSNIARDNLQRDFVNGNKVSRTSVHGDNIKRDFHITRLTKTEDITKIKGWRKKQFAVETSNNGRSDVNNVVAREVRMGSAEDNDDNAGPSLREVCGEEHSLCAFVCPDLDNYLDEDGKSQTDEENTSLNSRRGNRSHEEHLPSTSTASKIRKSSRWSGSGVLTVTKSSPNTRHTRKSNRKFQSPLRRSLRNRNTEAKNENTTNGRRNKNENVQRRRKVAKRKKNQVPKKKVGSYTMGSSAHEVEQKFSACSVFVKKIPITRQKVVLPVTCCFRYKSADLFPKNNMCNDEERITETGARSLKGRGKTELSGTASARKLDAASGLCSEYKTHVRITQRRNSKATFVNGSPVNDKPLNESMSKPPEMVVVEDDEEVVINANDYVTLNCDPNFIIEEISTVSFERATSNGFCFEETAQVFRLVGKLLPEVALLREIRPVGKNEPNLRWWIMNIMQDFACIKVKIIKKIGTVWRKAIIKARKTNSPCFISFKGSDPSRPMGIVVNPRLWPYFLIGPYYLNDQNEVSLKVNGKSSRIDYFPPFDSTGPTFRLKRFISSLIIHSWRNKRDVVGMWLHERIGMKSYNFIEVLTKPRKIEFFDPLSEMEVMLPSVSEVTNEKPLDVHSSGKKVTGEESVERSEKIYLIPDVPDLGYVRARLHPDQTITVERPLYSDKKISCNRINDFLNEAIKQHLTQILDELDVKWTIVKSFSKISKHKCLKLLDIKRIRSILEIESLKRQSKYLMNNKIRLERERESLFRKYLKCLASCDLEENAKRTIQVYLNRIISRAQMEQGILPGRSESETSLCLHILNMFLLVTLAKWSGTSETSHRLRASGEYAVPNYALPDEKKEDGYCDGIQSKRHLSAETLDKLDCKLRILFEILGKSKSPDVATHRRLKSKLNSLARYIEEMRIDAIYSATNETGPRATPGIPINESRKEKLRDRKRKEE